MIDSIEKLYEYVNRFHGLPAKRPSGERGEFVFGGVGRVNLNFDEVDTISGVSFRDVKDFLVRVPGDADEWVPLSEFDEKAAGATIERWEYRHAFELALKNAREATERLRSVVRQDLHPHDRSAVRKQYGLQLENITPEYEEDATIWPDE